MKYAFFPGCALASTARPYGMSTKEVTRVLGMNMPELADWNCCGASVFQSLDELSYLSLSGRNLALAEKNGAHDMVTPCSGCFSALGKASDNLARYPDQRELVDEALSEAGLTYSGDVRVRHLLDVLVGDVGLDAVRAKVTQPLTGLRVVCYYGCLLTRPPAVTGADHPENPVTMDRLVEALGAETLDWSHKTECCGASFSLARPELVTKLTSRILDSAREVGAEMVVTACPLCQTNLDMNREEGSGVPLPIVYFTQLMGQAFGLSSETLGLDKHFSDPVPALCRYGLTTQASSRV